MYHPTTRVLTVLELLQSYPEMSGRELAQRLEVDIRTVRRYVVMLQDLGIPVESERGRYGAYRLRPGFKLPPLMFNEEEALALTLGLLVSRRLGLPASAPAVEGALAKIERVMPQRMQEQLKAVQSALVMNLAPPEVTPESRLLLTLSTAVQHEQSVQLQYRSWVAAESERVIDPYGVVYYNGIWYTVGYCHLRSDLRTFRLDRIIDAALCDEHFTAPQEFDAMAHVLRSIALVPAEHEVEVLLKTTFEQAKSQVDPVIGILEPATNGVLFRGYMQNIDWFARYLVRLNIPFVIRKPDELRSALHRLVARITEFADDVDEDDEARQESHKESDS